MEDSKSIIQSKHGYWKFYSLPIPTENSDIDTMNYTSLMTLKYQILLET